MASAEVFFHLGKELRIDLAVEVIGQFGKKLRAVHYEPSFFFRK